MYKIFKEQAVFGTVPWHVIIQHSLAVGPNPWK